MTGMDLAGLRRLAEQATPGPWAWLPGDTDGPGFRFGGQGAMAESGYIYSAQDAEYVAACDPGTVLALIHAVEAARELVRRDVTLAQVAHNERVLIAALAPFTAGGET